MSASRLGMVRVYTLEAGNFTPKIFSFQYYPAVIHMPAFKPFEEELKKHIGIPLQLPIWVYHHDPKTNTLVPVDADNFKGFISHGLIRVFVETKRPLAGPELTLVLPNLSELGSLSAAIDKDRKGDPRPINSYIERLGNLMQSIIEGLQVPDDATLESMLVCTKERPVCEKCGKRVEPMWYLNKKSFGALCTEDADLLFKRGDPLTKYLFFVYTNGVFKYEKQFEELHAEFRDVPEARIRHLLWINLGAIENARAVLNSGFKLGYRK